MAIQSLDQENLKYTSGIREFPASASISNLRMKDLADAMEMGLGGSLVVVAAVLAAVSKSTLRGIPGTHTRVFGPGQSLRSDLRWLITGDRSSIALSSD